MTAEGMTADRLAENASRREDFGDDVHAELNRIRELLRARRLPLGESYIFPCMDPHFCEDCELLPCACPENDVRGMPGSLY